MNKLMGFLGLVRKSGRLIAGVELCENALSKGQLKLLIMATDASDVTTQSLSRQAEGKGVEIIRILTKNDLGSAIGKGQIGVVGIKDHQMSKKLKELCAVM